MEDDYFDWTGGYQIGNVVPLTDKPSRKKKNPIGFSLPAKARAKATPRKRAPASKRPR